MDWVAFDHIRVSIDMEVNGSPGYDERIVERFTYNDLSFHESGAPVSLRVEQLRDFDDTQWIQTEKDFGWQRPLAQHTRTVR
ncbi:hypothetical protein [Rhodohalobacter sp.]|uniref:hypothetical protein n=1 Tax=Rhodohalobacter sp. TaxID=1974210 RepID=UPI002ACDC6FD|nr:hypothetical protein [Rhodohalobacter sp.]MDZ7757525.1 hypothetical protein [Rhodohalobacter sp.]